MLSFNCELSILFCALALKSYVKPLLFLICVILNKKTFFTFFENPKPNLTSKLTTLLKVEQILLQLFLSKLNLI